MELFRRHFAFLLLLHSNCARPFPFPIVQELEDIASLEDGSYGQPLNLKALGSSQTSLSLGWDLAVDPDIIESYRVYYSHQNFNDVKTIREPQPSHVLKGLEPYTKYEIMVASIINGSESLKSEPIVAETDVGEPSPPTITNATCYGTGMLLIEWTRPSKFHRSVDYYKIYYRSASANVFEDITIQTDANEVNEKVIRAILMHNPLIHAYKISVRD